MRKRRPFPIILWSCLLAVFIVALTSVTSNAQLRAPASAVRGSFNFAAIDFADATRTRASAGQAPTGTSKDVITMVQQDGTKVSLHAQKASWKPIRGAFRAEARRGVPAESLAVVKDPVSIEAPFANRDLPGGALFVVKLKKDKTDFTFQGDAAGTPNKRDVLVKTSDLKSVEKDGVIAYTLDGSRKLMPGYYAIVILDNQYMWPFEIR